MDGRGRWLLPLVCTAAATVSAAIFRIKRRWNSQDQTRHTLKDVLIDLSEYLSHMVNTCIIYDKQIVSVR